MRRLALTLACVACSVAHGDTPQQVTTKPGTAANYVLNVQGNASGTPLPVTGSFSASTTGRATAAAPSYVEGTDNPLSVDLSGNIRTLATAQTAAKATAADPSYTEGTTDPISQDLSGHLRVAGTFWQATQPVSGTFWQATQPVSGTFWQATQPVSGTVAVSNAFALDSSVNGLLLAQESSTSGQKGPIAQCAVTAAAPTYTTAKTDPLSCTTAGLLRVDGSGVTQPVSGTFWQATQPVSGTFWQATQPVSGTFWQATQPVSGTVTATQGNAGTNAQAWWTQIGDTSNGPAAVKAASTAAVAADKALVVAVSPNNTIAATESGTWTVQPGNTANTTAWLMNVGQFGGTNVSTGTGAGGAGIPRVTISNDSSLAANQSVNLAQVGGTNTLTGGTAGSLGVGGLAADGSAVSGNPVLVAGKGFNGISNALRLNCDKRIAFTTLGTTATVQQIALVAGQTIYVCGWYALISTAVTAVNIKWVTGTGTNCATGITDVTPLIFTTPTAAPAISNWNQAPMTGPPVAFSASASALCITQSSATNSTTLSGVIYYSQN